MKVCGSYLGQGASNRRLVVIVSLPLHESKISSMGRGHFPCLSPVYHSLFIVPFDLLDAVCCPDDENKTWQSVWLTEVGVEGVNQEK
jgi:hypothetical protein